MKASAEARAAVPGPPCGACPCRCHASRGTPVATAGARSAAHPLRSDPSCGWNTSSAQSEAPPRVWAVATNPWRQRWTPQKRASSACCIAVTLRTPSPPRLPGRCACSRRERVAMGSSRGRRLRRRGVEREVSPVCVRGEAFFSAAGEAARWPSAPRPRRRPAAAARPP